MRSLVLAALLAFGAALPAQVTVLNGASFRTGQPVAAGSWAAAFGTFTGVAQATATASPIPKTLGGVTVTVNGVSAPVYFVSPTQINFLVPFAVTAGVRNVEVKTGSATITGTVRVMSAAPGIFANPAGGAVLNQDGALNGEGARARRGQVIQIFATGPGALSRAIEDGAAAPSAPLALTTSTPEVFIAGVPAAVQFSGMAPGFSGLWQVNVTVPDRAFITGRVPLQLFMDGVDSNEVTIFIQ
ncbi:MAG: hypothetical protein JNM66_26285 [Bryobacterales bacterium]|nr:hypothetical protein [Bryobacterales bacterium]